MGICETQIWQFVGKEGVTIVLKPSAKRRFVDGSSCGTNGSFASQLKDRFAAVAERHSGLPETVHRFFNVRVKMDLISA